MRQGLGEKSDITKGQFRGLLFFATELVGSCVIIGYVILGNM